MRRLSEVFPNSRIDRIERHTGETGHEGKVMQARFTLAGQELAAMDAPGGHDFTFNEALSLQVLCEGQQEIDHYWSALSAGGEPGPCGWLEDRFGISWQIVPKAMSHWLASDDKPARERTFQAMLGMKKLDLPALEAAFAGR